MSEQRSKEFMSGWTAARKQWQTTGSVSPYPSDMEIERTKEASKPPVPVKKTTGKLKEA